MELTRQKMLPSRATEWKLKKKNGLGLTFVTSMKLTLAVFTSLRTIYWLFWSGRAVLANKVHAARRFKRRSLPRHLQLVPNLLEVRAGLQRA
jgi:hypothetical protein